MKGLEKIILIAVVVVPITICIILIKNIWKEDEEVTPNDSVSIEISDPYVKSGDEKIYDNSGDSSTTSGESGDVKTMAGQEFVTTLTALSKIDTNAVISSAIANVYLNSDEKSELVGKFEKHTTVTAQKYEKGWTRVTGTDSLGASVSGWVRTENVTFSDENTIVAVTNAVGKTGTVAIENGTLNVRSTASTTGKVLTTIAKDTKVKIEAESSGWYKVTINNVTGWVSAQYIKVD